jgi:hypothetical protein
MFSSQVFRGGLFQVKALKSLTTLMPHTESYPNQKIRVAIPSFLGATNPGLAAPTDVCKNLFLSHLRVLDLSPDLPILGTGSLLLERGALSHGS